MNDHRRQQRRAELDPRMKLFGYRLIALALAFANLGLVFGANGRIAASVALIVIALTLGLSGIVFYWGGRWEVDDPSPAEVANTALLAIAPVGTGILALVTAPGAASWISFPIDLWVAFVLARAVRAQLAE